MPTIHIKICGVTNAIDACFAADAGADALGLNFYPKSPRFLSGERATTILRELPPFVAPIGVFVGTLDEVVKSHAHQLGLRGVQTYSDEPPAVDFFPSAHIPAFRVKDQADLDRIQNFLTLSKSKTVLVDSFVAGEMGGTGHVAPWHLLTNFQPGARLILAGGLTPDNVADAIRLVRPWGVDVASGVESVPGVKDPGKVRAFIQNARAALAELR